MTGRLLLTLALAAPACLAAEARSPASIEGAIAKLVAQLEEGTPEEIESLAIWQWEDEGLPPEVRRAFRDDLEIALIQSRFQFFDRDRFRQILKEHRLNLEQLVDPAAMKAVAGAIHAFLSVEVVDASAAHPEAADQDTHCILRAKLTDAKTAAIAWASYTEGANPQGLKALFGGKTPADGTTRYRQVAQAVAKSLAASDLAEAEIKTLTLSSPPKDKEGVGIGVRNPADVPFDLQAFEDELLLALASVQDLAYVDPDHIDRLIATWERDSEAVAQQNKQALAEAFALDAYLFGEIRGGDDHALAMSVRLVSLKDGSEAWAGKFQGKDTYQVMEPRALPEPPVPKPLPTQPEPLTLMDIERPLKPPIPQPELVTLPEAPTPPQLPDPFSSILYLPLGLPRDAVDTTFLVADRVPALGALTSGLYRYSGLGHLCRLGTRPRFRHDLASHRTLTYGQFQARDDLPTLFPLVRSARARYSNRANYLLQMSLGTLAVFDLFDALYATLDRTPVVGTATTPLLLPLDYAWRLVPDDRGLYLPQVTPGRPESRLTYGSLATEHPWSLMPNARSWRFTFATPAARRETYRAFHQQHEQAVAENRKRLKEWLDKEEARKKHNQEALDELRKRNRELQRQYELDLKRVRDQNRRAEQDYQRKLKQVEEHNARAARINRITRHLFHINDALTPEPAPQPQPKPKDE
ncbi:MAG: hypothetical protein ACOC8A_01990 [bacterium]